MTFAHWPADRCPACHATNSVPLTTNNRLCLEANCRHEWDPTHTFGPLGPAPAPELDTMTAPPVLAVVPEPDYGDPIAAARARYVGRAAVVHDVGAEGEITDIDDDGRATITFGSGYFIVCEPDEFSAVDDDEIPDEVIDALGAIDLTVAAQVIRAGITTISETNGTRALGMPPDGWLIPDVDTLPVVEHGASYAVALLAITFGMSTDDLEQIASGLDNAATAAREANTP